MNAARIALLAIACTLPLAAAAQWQWLDKDGRKVFSDKAPPPEIAADRILKGPKGTKIVPQAEPTAAAAAPVPAGAVLPKPSGTDKTLEERKKRADAADSEKKKAEEARVAAARAENCERAKTAKANYDTGVRMVRVDAKGERQYIDDSKRAEETRRLAEVIARDCVQ